MLAPYWGSTFSVELAGVSRRRQSHSTHGSTYQSHACKSTRGIYTQAMACWQVEHKQFCEVSRFAARYKYPNVIGQQKRKHRNRDHPVLHTRVKSPQLPYITRFHSDPTQGCTKSGIKTICMTKERLFTLTSTPQRARRPQTFTPKLARQ